MDGLQDDAAKKQLELGAAIERSLRRPDEEGVMSAEVEFGLLDSRICHLWADSTD